MCRRARISTADAEADWVDIASCQLLITSFSTCSASEGPERSRKDTSPDADRTVTLPSPVRVSRTDYSRTTLWTEFVRTLDRRRERNRYSLTMRSSWVR